MSIAPSHIYRVTAALPKAAADAVATTLEPHLDSVGWRAEESDATAHVTGFASGPPDEQKLVTAVRITADALGIDPPDLEVARIEVRDWVVDNLKDFPPMVAGRFFIHGAHYDGDVPGGLTGLRVPPGAAFGTGDHGSTKGCLLAIDGFRTGFRRVLDMGCGSGILAIAAAKRWANAERIIAADVDDRAVEVASNNVRANGVSQSIELTVSRGYRHPLVRQTTYDLILANILARPLCRMAGDLAAHLAPGGTAVLAGLMTHDANRVMVAHRYHGLALAKRLDIDGWTTLVLRGPAKDFRPGRRR